MNDIDTGLISYEVHYFDSNKIGFARSSDIPWIYSCGDDKDEAITHAKELIEEGYTKVKVIKRSIAFEEISF